MHHFCLKNWRSIDRARMFGRYFSYSQAMAPLQQHAAHNSKGGDTSHWLNTQSKYSEPQNPTFAVLTWHSTPFNWEYEFLWIPSIFICVHHCSFQRFVSCSSPSTSGFVPHPLIQAVAPLAAFAWRFCEALARTFSSQTMAMDHGKINGCVSYVHR